MEYDNTNKGAAWMVDHKQEKWHADAKGSQNVEGNEFWLDVKINATPDVASRIMEMIQENKDNPKAPDFKVTVRSKQPKSQPKDYPQKSSSNDQDAPF
jgi:hypothetical protein